MTVDQTFAGPEADETFCSISEPPLSFRALNLSVALELAAAGMAILPVSVVQDSRGRWKKKPAIRDWQKAATTNPDQIETWWDQFPQAVPGTELGGARLIVIDADRHEPNNDGVTAFSGLRPDDGDEQAHPITLTAGNGEHHYFAQPTDMMLGNAEGHLPPGINVRGAGGFVVAPGAVRPDGALWEPAPGSPELAAAFDAESVPRLPAWLMELLTPPPSLPKQSFDSRIGPHVGPREKAYAATALKASIAELVQTPAGARNNNLNAIAYRMGRMVARDWIDGIDVLSQLAAACEQNGLALDDGRDAVRETIESGLRAGFTRPHQDLPQG
jgi:hypothetical protein